MYGCAADQRCNSLVKFFLYLNNENVPNSLLLFLCLCVNLSYTSLCMYSLVVYRDMYVCTILYMVHVNRPKKLGQTAEGKEKTAEKKRREVTAKKSRLCVHTCM